METLYFRQYESPFQFLRRIFFLVKLNNLADLQLHVYISAFHMSEYMLLLFTSFELDFVSWPCHSPSSSFSPAVI